MKKIIKTLIIAVIITVFMFNVNQNVKADYSVYEVVIDQDSGRVLHSQNENEKRSMASTTKIVTCITVIDNFDLNTELKIKKEWTGIEGSSIYLQEGMVYTVRDLLYGLMLRSGNDAACALANGLAGSINEFCVLMNQTAEKAGAKNSAFSNPHGLDDENHYTTAYDLALITRYAMQNNTFCEIVSTKKYIASDGQNKHVWYNKNKMLNEYGYATGVKTGYTKKAGRCLVSSASKNGFNLICVVLDCGPMFERSKELLNIAYEKYSRVKLASCDQSVCDVQTNNGKVLPAYLKKDIFYPLTKEELKDISFSIKIYDKSQIKPKFAEECGTIKIFIKKQLLFVEKIYTILR